MYYMSSELYHYGIQGQKWGVRRYQNEDGTLTAAGRQRYGIGDSRKSRYNFIDRTAVKMRAFNQAMANRGVGAVNAATNKKLSTGERVKRTASYLIGNKGAASDYRVQAKEYRDLEQHAKTNLGRKYDRSVYRNSEALAKYHETAYKRDLGQRIMAYYFDADAWNTPYYRISGRKTTRGREFVNQMLTLGLAGQVMDYKYWKSQKETQPIKKKTVNA